MDREEAIDLLDNLIGFVEDNHSSDYDMALKMAIEALKQEPSNVMEHDKDHIWYKGKQYISLSRFLQVKEPCEDAISRDELLKAIDTWDKFGFEHTGCFVREPKDDFITYVHYDDVVKCIKGMPPIKPQEPKWISVNEGLPETDNENEINEFNVLLWVKNKSHPEREPQIYLGKLKHVEGDDGSGNFWGIETKPCDWAIWGWCYFNEPEVIAWQPLPQPYKAESEDKE